MRLSDWVFRLGVALLSVDGAFGAPYPVVTDERESISRSPAHNRRDSGQQDVSYIPFSLSKKDMC